MKHIPGAAGLSYTVGAGEGIPVMRQWLQDRNRHPVACDIETAGLGTDARKIKAVTFADDGTAVILNPREPADHRAIRRFIEHARALTFHNSTYDVPNLALAGLFREDDCFKVTDTLIYARLAWPDVMTKKDLESLAVRLLGHERSLPLKDIFKMLGLTQVEGWKAFDLDRPVYTMGAAKDAVVTSRLLKPVRFEALRTITTGHPFTDWGVEGLEALRLVEREQVINRMMLKRAVKGLRVDLEFLDRYRAQHGETIGRAASALEDLKIRPGNAGDLITALGAAGAIGDDWPRTPTGRPSTAAGHLERLDHPITRAYVEHKQLTKIDKDYVSKAVELSLTDAAGDDRIYPTTNLLKATTGRASMGGVPLHQFPEGARGVVLADPGDALVSIDWSQIEPVLIANIAGDVELLAGYEDGSSDVYTALGERANITRKSAKVTLLAQLYGEGMAKLSADLGISVDEAFELRDWLWRAMPKTGRLVGRLRGIAKEYRKIFTLSGRILTIPMGSYDGQVSVQSHKGVNFFVQGGAYDMLAETLIAVDGAGLGDAIYLTMHDELVVSRSAAHDIRKLMETPPARLIEIAKRTPVIRTDMADLGERWAAA